MYSRNVMCFGGTGSTSVWIVDMVYVPVHLEDYGRLTPQVGP